MLRVGLTGGIGSGKSVVSQVFQALGYKVYDSDRRAATLMTENLDVIDALKSLIGVDAYLDDGRLNKQVVGSFIFGSDANRLAVNSIVHPAVFNDFSMWCESHNSDCLLFAESAILFESGMDAHVDRTVLVYAPATIRISRVMSRDSLTKEQVESRISSQIAEEDKMKLVDFIINNSSTDKLLPQIFQVLDSLL